LFKCLHEYFLGHLFNYASLPEETAGEREYPGTVTAHDLSKRRLVAVTCQLRQLQVRALIVIDTQKRSSNNSVAGDASLWGVTEGAPFSAQFRALTEWHPFKPGEEADSGTLSGSATRK
jgi:hypothetical protein